MDQFTFPGRVNITIISGLRVLQFHKIAQVKDAFVWPADLDSFTTF